MNLIDKAIASVAPIWGARRAAARSILNDFTARGYAAAGSGRRAANLQSTTGSANAEVRMSLKALRGRSRQFVRDNWAGQRILDVLTSHLIGTGITTVADSGSDALDQQIRAERDRFWETCDVEGVTDYAGLQALAVRSMLEGGDAVIRMITQTYRPGSDEVPLKLQGNEGDIIDETREALDGTSRLGVKLGPDGEREGLYLHASHPGEMRALPRSSTLWTRDQVCHVFRPLRFGQVRGVPVFAPVLLTARDLADLLESAIVAARTQAAFAAFIHREPGVRSPLVEKNDAATGQKFTSIEPGMVLDIGESKITFSQPSAQAPTADMFVRGLYALAAGAGITFDQLTGDLSNANYSSLRAGKIEFRRIVEQIQWTVLVPQMIRPIDRAFIRHAQMAGRLPNLPEVYRCKHIMPAIEPIDPKKDMEADILAVRSGRLAPQEFVSSWGYDWRDVVADNVKFYQAVADASGDLNLQFDIDPRKARGGGTHDNASQPAD